MSTDARTRTFFHGSPSRFSTPNHVMMARNRQGHTNGALGLWVTEDLTLARRFGVHTYRLEVVGNCQQVGIDELARLNSKLAYSEEDYVRMRQQFVDNGISMIDVVELSGKSHMAVVLDLNAVIKFEETT